MKSLSLSFSRSYLHWGLGVLKNCAIDKCDFEDDFVLLVNEEGITLAVIGAAHLVAIRIQLDTTCLVKLYTSELLLDGSQYLGVPRRSFVRQEVGELRHIKVNLSLAINHVRSSDHGMSRRICTHCLPIHIAPGCRLVCVQVDHNFAIDRFAVGVAKGSHKISNDRSFPNRIHLLCLDHNLHVTIPDRNMLCGVHLNGVFGQYVLLHIEVDTLV